MALDSRVLEELVRIKDQMIGGTELLSREQLDLYYARFRDRFGPERLANLDGEELLAATVLASGNQDNLMYWLEFKNDDEFPKRFGSIAGGSSYKYGLFYSQAGKWMAGSALKQQEVTRQQAIELARAQRDQLVLGCEVLSGYADAQTDDQYRELQARLMAAAPSVADTAWGHKYFSLIFHLLLDDFHVPYYQRFHIIRLLQELPHNDGRYVCAGRFTAVARELDLPLQNVSAIINKRDGSSPYHYYRIGTTIGPSGKSIWPTMESTGRVSIGWRDIGDLSPLLQIGDDAKRKQAIKSELIKAYNYGSQTAGQAASQINMHLSIIAANDIVVAMEGSHVLGIGRVTGGYVYDPAAEFPHQRPVDWLSLEPWQMNPPEGLMSTVRALGKYPENLVDIERKIVGKAPVAVKRPDAEEHIAPGNRGDDADNANLPPPPALTGIPARVEQILARKGQVILYGPPGTGKTYWAEVAAHELAARSWFGKMYSELNLAQKSTVVNDAVRLCSFHPAYGYEDFMEAYRPDTSPSGQMRFERRDGVFKSLCAEAEANERRSYYLIIDEINRGDIPRIFGELLTLLEKNKRGKEMQLPLSGQPFSIPQNIYVIGTMNTADRSIALLDVALRRRFGFIELMPDPVVLGKAAAGTLPLKPWLESLNSRILQHVGRDSRNLQIGHAYLLDNTGQAITDFAAFARVLREDIIPLLEEYCYEDYGILEKLLGSSLIDSKRQQINEEMFEPQKSDDLRDALLGQDQAIAMSEEARDLEADQTLEPEDEPENDVLDESDVQSGANDLP